MTKIRAKFKVNKVTKFEGSEIVNMNAVYGVDPNHENKVFTNYTPNGSIEINISADAPAFDKFSAGKEYYVDFSESE